MPTPENATPDVKLQFLRLKSDAAARAAPFRHPKLASFEVKRADPDLFVQDPNDPDYQLELARRVAYIFARHRAILKEREAQGLAPKLLPLRVVNGHSGEGET